MDRKELYVTADLARIEVTESEIDELAKNVDRLLEYFALMDAIDSGSLEPTTHALIRGNRLRKDLHDASADADELVDRAPEREDRFFAIPNVL